jgi:hypothetical protein
LPDRRREGRRLGIYTWQIDLEGRTQPGLAVNPYVAAALFHDAVYRRQTEARALAFIFVE